MKHTSLFLIVLILLLSILGSCAKPEQPLSAAELLDLGEKYLLELDYEQALVQFLKVIEVDPMNPRGYSGAAEAYVGLGETEKAIAVLQDGLIAIPENTELQIMLQEFQTPEQESASEPITVSRENPITVSGRIDRKSVLFADKFNEYKGVYESEDGKTILSDGTCILFDSLADVIIDGEALTLNGAILATSEVENYIGQHVTLTGYFSKQDYKFQQEITGPYSLAELLDNPDEDGYVYYFNPVGSYLFVIDEIVELEPEQNDSVELRELSVNFFGEIAIQNLRYELKDGDPSGNNPEGFIGYTSISFDFVLSSIPQELAQEIKTCRIWAWQETPFTEEEAIFNCKYATQIWGIEDYTDAEGITGSIGNGFPTYEADRGKQFQVCLVATDNSGAALGYCLADVTVPE